MDDSQVLEKISEIYQQRNKNVFNNKYVLLGFTIIIFILLFIYKLLNDHNEGMTKHNKLIIEHNESIKTHNKLIIEHNESIKIKLNDIYKILKSKNITYF
jgi:hypothetical protein